MSSPTNIVRLGALILALVFAAGAGYGGMYAAFALDYDALDAARSGNRPVEAMGFWRRPPDVKPALAAWSTRDGMGGAARRRIALDTDTPANVSARFVDVTKALASEPTSGWLWLEYTSLCLDLPFCRDKAAPAHALIEITARREGLIQREAAFMLVKHWEAVSPEMRHHAVALLDAVMPRAGRAGEERLRELLGAKTPEAREEIRGAVLAGADPQKLQGWKRVLR